MSIDAIQAKRIAKLEARNKMLEDEDSKWYLAAELQRTRIAGLEAELDDAKAHHEAHHLDCEIANHDALQEVETDDNR